MHFKARYISAIPFCISAPDYFNTPFLKRMVVCRKIQLHVGKYMLYD